MIPLSYYLILSLVLFCVGMSGVILRRNIIVILMSLELMFNAVNISFVAFSYYLRLMTGRIFVVFSITIAAAEVAIGLAILVLFFRTRNSVNVDEANTMRG